MVAPDPTTERHAKVQNQKAIMQTALWEHTIEESVGPRATKSHSQMGLKKNTMKSFETYRAPLNHSNTQPRKKQGLNFKKINQMVSKKKRRPSQV